MSEFPINAIRADFPILNQVVHKNSLIYLDNAATTQLPTAVMQSLLDHWENDNANVHRGAHALASRSTRALESARETLADFIGANEVGEVIFTNNTTDAINMLAQSWGKLDEGPRDVLITALEHHANFVPWQQLCQEQRRTLHIAPLTETGEPDTAWIADKLATGTIGMTAVTAVSNVTGGVTPLQTIISLAHKAHSLVLVDAAQAMRHSVINVKDLDCDFLAFSGHKMLAPMGIGALYGKTALLEALPPVRFGGEMVGKVKDSKTTFQPAPLKFEAGTPNVPGARAFGAACNYLSQTGREAIAAYEDELLARLEQGLTSIPGVMVLGNPAHRSGCVSVALEGAHVFDLAALLDAKGIATRAGNLCAQPLLARLNHEFVLRFSPAFYNTQEEIDTALEVTEMALGKLGRKRV